MPLTGQVEEKLAMEFSGVNRAATPSRLPPNVSPDCLNCFIVEEEWGKLGARMGRTRAHVESTGERIVGFGLISLPISEQRLFSVAPAGDIFIGGGDGGGTTDFGTTQGTELRVYEAVRADNMEL